jgi:hypothetical protein
MNKFKILSLLIVAIGLFVSSCTINDDYPVEARQYREVTVSPVDADMYAGEGVDFQFRFQVSEPIENNMLIEFSTPDGINGSANIPAGSMYSEFVTAQFPVDDEVTFEGVQKSLNFNMDISVLHKPEDLNVKGSGSIDVLVFDKLPATEDGMLNILVDWIGGETGSPDMEVFIVTGDQDAYGSVVDYADTWGADNRWEEVQMVEANWGDGVYSYFLREYFGAYPVTYKVFIRESSGALTIMDGYMATGPVFGGDWIFTFNKSTSGGDVSYVFNQL